LVASSYVDKKAIVADKQTDIKTGIEAHRQQK
jgi:hypothetical protein